MAVARAGSFSEVHSAIENVVIAWEAPKFPELVFRSLVLLVRRNKIQRAK